VQCRTRFCTFYDGVGLDLVIPGGGGLGAEATFPGPDAEVSTDPRKPYFAFRTTRRPEGSANYKKELREVIENRTEGTHRSEG